jgi:hypothetical protein
MGERTGGWNRLVFGLAVLVMLLSGSSTAAAEESHHQDHRTAALHLDFRHQGQAAVLVSNQWQVLRYRPAGFAFSSAV